MAVTVEDGSIVTGADSYVSRADYITYAASLGVTVADDEDADAELVEASQFIDSFERSMVGKKTDRDQPMAFPRYDVVIEDYYWDSDEIPRQVELCQMAYALQIHQGVDIFNPEPVRTAKREKVEGAVEVEYFGQDSGVKLSRNSRAEALLHSFLVNQGLYSITAVRA